jgi:hypothetical protein
MTLPHIGIWIAAFLTLACFTFLYKDNPFFRFAESLFAGVSLGYYVGIVLNQTLVPNLFEPMQQNFGQNWDLLVPGLLGVILFMRYAPRIGWVSRYALAIYVTYYIGVEFTRKLHGELLPQLSRLIRPLSAVDAATLVSAVYIVGVLSVLVYFFFSKEQDAITKRISRVGIWFLMISFGAAFGFTVMGRVALLIGRLNFLILDWIYPTFGV